MSTLELKLFCTKLFFFFIAICIWMEYMEKPNKITFVDKVLYKWIVLWCKYSDCNECESFNLLKKFFLFFKFNIFKLIVILGAFSIVLLYFLVLDELFHIYYWYFIPFMFEEFFSFLFNITFFIKLVIYVVRVLPETFKKKIKYLSTILLLNHILFFVLSMIFSCYGQPPTLYCILHSLYDSVLSSFFDIYLSNG